MMAKFEAIFSIPPEHRLETQFHSHGGGQYESWTHQEYDQKGMLIAQYKSWAHTTYAGVPTDEGWEKFDLDGHIIASGKDLPI
jgi:hypothetical protein